MSEIEIFRVGNWAFFQGQEKRICEINGNVAKFEDLTSTQTDLLQPVPLSLKWLVNAGLNQTFPLNSQEFMMFTKYKNIIVNI